MNLPSYSLSDVPPSNILNVCLATKPYNLLNSNQSTTTTNSKKKGKEPEVYQEVNEEDEWEDAEYRNSRITKRPSIQTKKPFNSNTFETSSSHDNLTGWDEFFATANTEGWTIYGINPLRIIQKHMIPNASLKIVLPIHRSNIIFLVGGPPSPLYSPNKVIIYDLSISKAISSIEFSSQVLGLTARRDILIVVLLNRLILFNLYHQNQTIVEEEGEWDTCDNPRGLVCLSTEIGSTLLVFPGRQSGQVQIVQLPAFDPNLNSRPIPRTMKITSEIRKDPYPSTSILVAHTTPLAALAITPNGHLIATASVTGTLIRIWDSKSSKLLRELRRGTDGASVWGLRFKPDGSAICASSDKGTIHLWNLTNPTQSSNHSKQSSIDRLSTTPPLNPESKKPLPLKLIKPYLPKYFHSKWSDSYYRLPNINQGTNSMRSLPNLFQFTNLEDDVSLISWIIENQIIVITRSGGWFRLKSKIGQDELECLEFQNFGDDHDELDWSSDED
ncbi:WD repeat domain phosphoinositide-interacting protein 4 [Melampsora americana]|nr:WD repeat domain phosphoinositide-interacting protein 4 [Melampsora americana]